jgi:type I restriction enzyme M protein
VYDLRAQSQRFTKRSRLERSIFDDFVRAFGDDPHGLAKRKEGGERGRFRCFTRQDIANRGDRLNLAWLDDGRTASLSGTTSEQLAGQLETTLSEALLRVHAIRASLRTLRS